MFGGLTSRDCSVSISRSQAEPEPFIAAIQLSESHWAPSQAFLGAPPGPTCLNAGVSGTKIAQLSEFPGEISARERAKRNLGAALGSFRC